MLVEATILPNYIPEGTQRLTSYDAVLVRSLNTCLAKDAPLLNRTAGLLIFMG